MKLKDLPIQLYHIFNMIYLYQNEIRTYKDIEYVLTKDEKKILKNIYRLFHMSEHMKYKYYKKLCINLSINTSKDIDWCSVEIVKYFNKK